MTLTTGNGVWSVMAQYIRFLSDFRWFEAG